MLLSRFLPFPPQFQAIDSTLTEKAYYGVAFEVNGEDKDMQDNDCYYEPGYTFIVGAADQLYEHSKNAERERNRNA